MPPRRRSSHPPSGERLEHTACELLPSFTSLAELYEDPMSRFGMHESDSRAPSTGSSDFVDQPCSFSSEL